MAEVRAGCQTCTGYLGHPFKTMPLETQKDFHPRLANTGGSV